MRARLAAGTVLLAVLAGCSDPATSPERDASGTPSESGSPSPGPDEGSPGSPEDGPAPGLPEPGTADAPAAVEAAVAPLDWRELADPEQATVTVGGGHTLTVDRSAGTAVLEGATSARVRAPRSYRIADALLTGTHALVVAQHEQETRPAVATVIDLGDGSRRVLDGDSRPATTTGGSWALAEDRVLYPTFGRDRRYCLAESSLTSGEGGTAFCAEPGNGFTQVRRTPAGLSLLSFAAPEDGKPSCRTVVEVGEAMMSPFPGVPDCVGWEGLLLADGAAWTVVPNENQVEAAEVRARVGDGYFDLGPGSTGSLVWCAGAAYFSREPQREGRPARLLRWDGESLQVVLEAGEGGPATLSAPRCGGDAVTVSLLAATGDQQLTAPTG